MNFVIENLSKTPKNRKEYDFNRLNDAQKSMIIKVGDNDDETIVGHFMFEESDYEMINLHSTLAEIPEAYYEYIRKLILKELIQWCIINKPDRVYIFGSEEFFYPDVWEFIAEQETRLFFQFTQCLSVVLSKQ